MNRSFPGPTLAGVFALLLLAPAGPPGHRQEPEPVVLRHAGVTNFRRGQGEQGSRQQVVDLSDSVYVIQGEQHVLADRASYVRIQDQVRLWGNVRGWDGVWQFRADEVIYRGNDRTLLALGRVEAENLQDGSRLKADQFFHDRNTGQGRASGHPWLYQPPADSTASATEVSGDETAWIDFQRDQGWAELTGGGVVRRGEMVVHGAWLRSQDKPRILTVREKVRLERRGMEATGEQLVWDETTGLARLNGSPPLLTRLDERVAGSPDSVWIRMKADSIDLHLPNEGLESIHLFGPGEVTIITRPGPGSTMAGPDSTLVPAVPEHMVLVGREIDLTIREEELRYLTAGRGAMYYWRQDHPDRSSAMGGLKLEILFEGGEPAVVTATGNATSRFFQSMVEPGSDMIRALGTLIRLTLMDGELKEAHLEKGSLTKYSAVLVETGRVPMAVHPDSVQVGAARPPAGRRAQEVKPPGRPPP
jgi:lipopolysaccharide export system protein LptA